MHMSLIDGPGRAGHSLTPRWAALLMVVGLVACKTQPLEEHVPSSPSLYLELASLNGEAVSKARVRLTSGEERQVTEQGTVLLDNLSVGHHALQVRAEGFSQTVLAFDMGQDIRAGARLKLLPLGEPQLFDASTETLLPVGDMQLTIPAGALRDAQGNPIRGQVEAYLSALDLENGELLAAPGVLEGVPFPGAEPVGLESLGMVSIVFQQKGQVIPFARGTHIGGNVPGRPGSAGSPDGRPGTRRSALSSASAYPSHVPIWRLDAENGRWVPTGNKALVTGGRWEATLDNTPTLFNVALPFWWRSPEANSDNPLQPPTPRWVGTVCLKVKVEDEKNQPVAGRMVVAQGEEYKGLTRAMTDAGGWALLEVMRGQSVNVDAGEQAIAVFTDSGAGTCSGEGAQPMPVTLKVAAPLCMPGAARDCAYKGPTQGICRAARQTCDAQGSAWSACAGEVRPQKESCDNAEDDDCDGTINESCERLCQEGETKPCYDGPAGTKDVGVCHGGTRTCVAGGTAWSEACEGQVLPTAEDYTRPQDEDCDGRTGHCLPGVRRRCEYTGPVGTEDVGACRAGSQPCNDSGTDWDSCTDEVRPLPEEDCTTPEDDNCDGQRNELNICICVPGFSAPCYEGPDGTEDVGVCRGGTQTCVEGKAWSACEGQVKPTAENYAQPEDEDCNGRAEVCASGSSRPCPYTGPAGTKDVGICHAGTQMCNGTGTDWEACTGEVTPQAESCASVLDEDCDGYVNEAPPCGWVVTTSMTSARAHHATVVLNDGKVLVMGGVGASNEALDTAAVYDPAAKTWTTVGSMGAKRKNFTAVRLNDGSVLVMGGKNDSSYLSSAEVYDPVSQNWTTITSVGSMATARESHTATLLSNGQVLVTGGYGSGEMPLATAEVYDPVNKDWTIVAPSTMGTPRALHTATRLTNGKVLVIGGKSNSTTSLASAEVYDPAGRTWLPVHAMNGGARFVHTATLLSNGHVLVAGGFRNGANVRTTEVYDPDRDEWTSVGLLNTERDEHTAVLLSTGHVLVAGGDNSVIATTTAEMYDPAAKTWTIVAPMTAARAAHTMVLLDTGEVLVIGGRSTSNSGTLVTTEVYNPAAPTIARAWMSTRSMSIPRHSHTATLLPNGKVLVAGGNDSTILKSAEVYDPASGEWTPTGDMKSTREAHTATLLPDGKVLVVGGRNGTVLDTAEVYNPVSGEWSYTENPLGSARVQHTATLLTNGKVLIAGGHDGTAALSSAWLYDPVSKTWSDAGNMLQARRWHTATLLPDGKVLITGGQDGSHSIGTAELYDPDASSSPWTTLPALSLTRDWHTAIWLGNGKVLVSGGYDDNGGSFRAQSELYTPGAPAWTNTLGPLLQARREHTATLLDNGMVLVVGGTSNPGSGSDIYLPSTELYDPVTDTWSSVNLLAAPVARHTATRLDNGLVLITGGRNDSGSLNSVLIYTP